MPLDDNHDQLDQHWRAKHPEHYEAGRKDAQTDLSSGLLRLFISVDAYPSGLGTLLSELSKHGIELDLRSDVGGPHPAYWHAYNFQMESEIDRRYGPDTLRSIWDKAEVPEYPKRKDSE